MAGTESMSAIAEQSVDSSSESLDSNLVDIKSLTDAFDIFNQKTRKLRESYNGLKKQVELVNEELRQKNEILKKKIDELDMTRDYLNNIVESMSNGLIAVNLRGRITTFNKAAEKITGYSRREILGKKYSSVFPEEKGGFPILERMIRRPDQRVRPQGCPRESGTERARRPTPPRCPEGQRTPLVRQATPRRPDIPASE